VSQGLDTGPQECGGRRVRPVEPADHRRAGVVVVVLPSAEKGKVVPLPVPFWVAEEDRLDWGGQAVGAVEFVLDREDGTVSNPLLGVYPAGPVA
jgi:hypothetical protein